MLFVSNVIYHLLLSVNKQSQRQLLPKHFKSSLYHMYMEATRYTKKSYSIKVQK